MVRILRGLSTLGFIARLVVMVLLVAGLSPFVLPSRCPHSVMARTELGPDGMLWAAPLFPTAPKVTGPLPGHMETTDLPAWSSILTTSTGLIFLYGEGTIPYRSADGGHVWEALIIDNDKALSLVVSPAFHQDNTLFAGLWSSGKDAFRISSDGGRSWRSPSEAVPGPVNHIAVSPAFASDRTVYVAMDAYSAGRQLWRSTDGGECWEALTYPGTEKIEQIVLSPSYAADKTLYVRQQQNTLWRSDDGGATWQRSDAGLGSAAIYDVAATPWENGIALLAATSQALMISHNRGSSWSEVCDRPFRHIVVAANHTGYMSLFGIEYLFGRLWRSNDSGSSWSGLLPGEPVDGLALSTGFVQDQTVYARSGTSFWSSEDGGGTWSLVSTRISDYDEHVPRMDILPSPDFDNDPTVFAYRRYDAVSKIRRSQDGGFTWTELDLPPEEWQMPFRRPMSLDLSPSFPKDRTVLAVFGQHLFKSEDAGEVWKPVGESLPTSETSLLAVSPGYPADQTIFIGSYMKGIYRSKDHGKTWQLLTGAFTTGLAVSPDYPDDPTLFVTRYNDGVFRSDDGGDTWTHLSNLAKAPDFRVKLSPTFSQDGILFVTVSGSSGGGAFRSDNRGESWTDIGADQPPSYVNTLAVSPHFDRDQTLMMGADHRPLLVSEDAGLTWFPLPSMPQVGDYARSNPGALTYEDSLLLPLASTQNAVFRYRWPKLRDLPQRLTFCLQRGDAESIQRSLALTPDDVAPASWQVEEEASWLAVSPMSGTLPATLNLTVQPTGLQRAETKLTITVDWSVRQVATHTVTVEATYLCQSYLPLALSWHRSP